MAFVSGPNAAASSVGIECPIGRMQLHEARRRAGKNRVGTVIFVERLEDDHFIAGIDDGHHRRHHRFRRTAANRDFAFRIDGDALRALEFLSDRVAKRFRTPGDGVLIDVRVDGFLRGALDFSRSAEIGKSLREIDGAMLQAPGASFRESRIR